MDASKIWILFALLLTLITSLVCTENKIRDVCSKDKNLISKVSINQPSDISFTKESTGEDEKAVEDSNIDTDDKLEPTVENECTENDVEGNLHSSEEDKGKATSIIAIDEWVELADDLERLFGKDEVAIKHFQAWLDS